MGSALEAFSASLRRRNDRFLGVNFKLSYLHNLKSYRSHLLHGNSPGHFTLKTAIKKLQLDLLINNYDSKWTAMNLGRHEIYQGNYKTYFKKIFMLRSVV